jgi:ADP-ribose pyrophosphatase
MMEEQQLHSTIKHIGRILTVRHDVVSLPNGKTAIRDVVDHAPAVVILPFQAPDTVYLIRQFRYPTGKTLIETCAGCMDPGEDPLDAAKRELAEETGIRARTWIPLTEGYPSPGFCNEYMYFYIAQDLEFGQPDTDEDEFVDVVKMSLAELEDQLRRREIVDLKTATAFLGLARWVLHG